MRGEGRADWLTRLACVYACWTAGAPPAGPQPEHHLRRREQQHRLNTSPHTPQPYSWVHEGEGRLSSHSELQGSYGCSGRRP